MFTVHIYDERERNLGFAHEVLRKFLQLAFFVFPCSYALFVARY